MKKCLNHTKAWSIGITALFFSLTFFPITAIPHRSISASYSDSTERIEVTCQIFTHQGIEQVTKEIPQEVFKSLSTLANELSSIVKEESFTCIRQHIRALVTELKDADLLPQAKSVDETVDMIVMKWKMSQRLHFLTNMLHRNTLNDDYSPNYLSFVCGYGKNTLGWRQFTFMVTDYVFAYYIFAIVKLHLSGELLYKLYELLWYRPKVFISIGEWESGIAGNITTLGLGGIKHWESNPPPYCDVGVGVIGFVGLTVTSPKINDSGFIVGFALSSLRIHYIYPP